jgi:hypothetical protein
LPFIEVQFFLVLSLLGGQFFQRPFRLTNKFVHLLLGDTTIDCGATDAAANRDPTCVRFDLLGIGGRMRREEAHAQCCDESIPTLVTNAARRAMAFWVGKATVFALAKRLNEDWSESDMQAALSKESLSIAADNYEESLQPIAAASANATSTLKQTMTDMKAAEAHRTESAEWI